MNKNGVDTKIETITKKVSTEFQKSKRALACYLNEKVNRLSPTHKRVSLVLFGFIVIMICASMIIRSLRDPDSSMSIDRITLPRDIYPSQHYKNGFEKMRRLKSLLDSLRKSPNGIAVYDSLMNARPGLMDSIGSLIRNYQSDYLH